MSTRLIQKLGIGVTLVSALARCTCDSAAEPIALTAIAPPSMRSGERVAVVITGSGFAPRVIVSYQSTQRTTVDTSFAAWLGETALEDVRYVDSATLTATAPAAMLVGVHPLIVQTPDGVRVTLTDAFEVLPLSPADAGPTEGGIDDGSGVDRPRDGAIADRIGSDQVVVDSASQLPDRASRDLTVPDVARDSFVAPDTALADTGMPIDSSVADAARTDAARPDAAAPINAGRLAIAYGASTTSTLTVTLALEEPGNLVPQPDQLASWTIINNLGNGWSSEGTSLFGEPQFCTSYDWDTRSRTLDLVALGSSAAQLDAQPPISVREWVVGYSLSGPAGYPDFYYSGSELRRQSNGSARASYYSGTRQSPLRTTETPQPVGKTYTGYGTGVRYLYVEDGGMDIEFWAGPYGARFDALLVHVGVVEMSLSNDDVNWSSWQAFAPTVPWTLAPATSGPHVVYVQFRDGSGQPLGGTADSIDVLLP